jgi:hypothetical protein
MGFTGYFDLKGKKIYVGDYLQHEIDGIGGVVEFKDGEYVFGGGYGLENYGADVTIVKT